MYCTSGITKNTLTYAMHTTKPWEEYFTIFVCVCSDSNFYAVLMQYLIICHVHYTKLNMSALQTTIIKLWKEYFHVFVLKPNNTLAQWWRLNSVDLLDKLALGTCSCTIFIFFFFLAQPQLWGIIVLLRFLYMWLLSHAKISHSPTLGMGVL